jgi:hypothetical protein
MSGRKAIFLEFTLSPHREFDRLRLKSPITAGMIVVFDLNRHHDCFIQLAATSIFPFSPSFPCCI